MALPSHVQLTCQWFVQVMKLNTGTNFRVDMCFLRINSAAVWNNGELEVLLDTSGCQFMSETFG